MNICVVGWYYTEAFYRTLRSIGHELLRTVVGRDHDGIPYISNQYSGESVREVFIVKHRMEPNPIIENVPGSIDASYLYGNPSELHSNVGLEFGAYDQYLKNHWDGKSPVLFIQDDTLVTDPDAFDQIAKLGNHGVQMAYIFSSEYEEIAMGGAHGRAIFCSAEFLTQLKELGGFPYDSNNHGNNTGPNENVGINSFRNRVKLLGNMNIGIVAIIPGIQHGRRGILNSLPYFFDRKSRDSCTILAQGVENTVVQSIQPMISHLRK